MATFKAADDSDMTTWNIKDILNGAISHPSADSFHVNSTDGLVYKFSGTDLGDFNAQGFPTDGTITGFSVSGGDANYQVSSAEISASDFYALLKGPAENLERALFSGHDEFILTAPGQDIVRGFSGSDVFKFGGTFDSHDWVDGGSGTDTIQLSGDYSAGLQVTGAMVTNVEKMTMGDTGSYDLTFSNDAIGKSRSMTIDASHLTSGHTLTFDDTAEIGAKHVTVVGGGGDDVITTGTVSSTVNGGAGDDTITTGSAGDTILAGAGVDHISAGAGDDVIDMGSDFGTGDTIDGGEGNDIVVVHELGAGTLTLQSPMLQNVETIEVQDGSGVTTVNLGQHTALNGPVTIDASDLTGGVLNFDGANALGAPLTILGSNNNDRITGSAQNDTIKGGGGADTMNGGGGSDTFVFDAADAASNAVDTIVGFNPLNDKIDLGSQVTGIGHSLLGGNASSIGDISGLVGNLLDSHDAMIVKPLLGALGGDSFLVVDQNGQPGFQAGQDLIVHLDHATHLSDLDLSNFLS